MKLAIILGTARETGLGHRVAKWITDTASADERFEVDFVDTAKLDLPFFNEDFSPKYRHYSGAEYTNPNGKAWAERVGKADGFILITPEYNHGISAILKNALDWVGTEWGNKPAGLVGYSMTPFGGVRAVEHLRQVVPQLDIYQALASVLVPAAHETVTEDGVVSDEALNDLLRAMLDEVHTLSAKNA